VFKVELGILSETEMIVCCSASMTAGGGLRSRSEKWDHDPDPPRCGRSPRISKRHASTTRLASRAAEISANRANAVERFPSIAAAHAFRARVNALPVITGHRSASSHAASPVLLTGCFVLPMTIKTGSVHSLQSVISTSFAAMNESGSVWFHVIFRLERATLAFATGSR
jgi:hypothetical protein